MIRCIVIAEGEVGRKSDAREFETAAEAEAYKQGVRDGAAHYGCGGCFGVSMDDMEYLKEEFDESLADEAREELQ